MDEALDTGTAAPAPAPPDPIPLLTCQACGQLAVAKPRVHAETGQLVWQPTCETPGCPNNPLARRHQRVIPPALAELPNRAARRRQARSR